MLEIIRDIRFGIEAAKAFRKVRLEEKRLTEIPVARFNYWSWTLESCLFYSADDVAIRDVFNTFDEATQKALTFAPDTTAGFVERAQLWKEALRPALPPEQYHRAMTRILDWYIKCAKKRNAVDPCGGPC